MLNLTIKAPTVSSLLACLARAEKLAPDPVASDPQITGALLSFADGSEIHIAGAEEEDTAESDPEVPPSVPRTKAKRRVRVPSWPAFWREHAGITFTLKSLARESKATIPACERAIVVGVQNGFITRTISGCVVKGAHELPPSGE